MAKNKKLSKNPRIIKKLKRISKTYGIKYFEKIEKGDYLCKLNGEDSYINRSVIIGNDHIQIGIYDNIEHMIASFFHEIGHIYNTKNNKINSESEAWIYAFYLAKKNGFELSQDAYEWAIEKLRSYNL